MVKENAKRRDRSLDGEWSFLSDPGENGKTKGWPSSVSVWLDDATTVNVPHTWQEMDEYKDYTGTVWYHRTIDIESSEINKKRVFVEFDAVDYRAEVWLNGIKAGENRGGYLPFELDVTEAIDVGENSLVVLVHDPEDLLEIPHGKQGDPWYTRVSGIWQSVTLHFRPEVYIDRADVTPDLKSDTAIVDIELELNETNPTDVTAEVRAYRDGNVAAVEAQNVIEQSSVELKFDDPAYWSPESPTLYTLDIILNIDGNETDRYEDYFGIRSIEYTSDGYLLNGEPIRLRGVLDQGYYPKTLYRPPSLDIFEREIEIMKELGFNFVRKHVKPAHPAFVEAADRNGILVWEEPANPTQYTDRSKEEVKNQLRDLISRDINRPSVITWSVYNEEWGIGHHDSEESLWTDKQKQTYLASIVETVREWDPTRLVCDNSGWAHVDTDINDYHRYYVSPDRATEWEDNIDHMLHHRGDNFATHQWSDSDPPVMFTELGTWAMSDYTTILQEYQKDPGWFSHEFITDPTKRPDGVEKRFNETDLVDVFGTVEALSESWHDRAMVSLKHVLGEIRKRDEIAGFVLTQLSDIEWEFNGLLDYFRNKKSFYDEFATVNDDIAIFVTPDFHVAWSEEERRIQITIVNDTSKQVTEEVEWRFGNATGRCPAKVPPHSVKELDPIEVTAPDVTTIQTESMIVGAVSDREMIAEEHITVVPEIEGAAHDIKLFAEGSLASHLTSFQFQITHQLTSDVDIALVSNITEEILDFITEGGDVIQIPDRQGEMLHNEFFEFQTLPKTEGWNYVSSFIYQDSPLLNGICSNYYLSWEFENAYPYHAVSDINPSTDTVHVGYVDGWLANWGSFLLERSVGEARVVACTFPIRRTIESQPVVTALVHRLINSMVQSSSS